MGFCTRCGSKKAEDGLCLKCDGGARRAPQPPPMQPRHRGHEQQPPPGYRGGAGYGHPPHGHPPHGHPPHGQPPHGQPPYGQPGHGHYGGSVQQGYHQAMRSDFMQDVIAIIKGFFSKNPENVFDRAYKSTNHIWLAFAGIFSVLFGLMVSLTPVVLLREMWIWMETIDGGRRSNVPSLREIRGELFDFILPVSAMELFFRGLLFAIVLFFVIYGIVKVMTNVVKPRGLPVSLLNVVSVGMIPASVCLLAGIIIGELQGTFGILLMSFGGTLAFIFMIIAILRIYGRIPYWAVSIGTVAYAIIVYLMLRFLLGIIVDEILDGMFWF